MARAYKKTYLNGVMRNLGVMMDCGVHKYGYSAGDFYDMFLSSDVPRQIGNGNPRYLAGLSGTELADIVVESAGKEISDENNGTYQVSPEYWAGWALAYYQWRSCRNFKFLQKKGLGINEVLRLYHPLHEADVRKFADVADEIIKASSKVESSK